MKASIPALKGRHIITQGFIPVRSRAPVGAPHPVGAARPSVHRICAHPSNLRYLRARNGCASVQKCLRFRSKMVALPFRNGCASVWQWVVKN